MNNLLSEAIKEYENENFSEALKLCEDVKSLGNTSLILFLIMGRILVQKGEFEKAKEQYKELLEYYPLEFNAWLELGNIYRKLAKVEDAIECYKKAIESRVDDERGYFALVRVLEENSFFAQAALFLHKALIKVEQKPKTLLKLAHHLGQFRVEIGEFDRALEIFRYALEVAKRSSEDLHEELCELHIDFGDVLMKLGLNDEAFEAFGFASNSNVLVTLNRLSEISLRYHLTVEAKELIQKAILIEPDNYVSYDNLAALHANDWLLDEAMKVLQQGKEKNKKNELNDNVLSSIYSKSGDIDNSLKILKKLIDNGDDKARSSAAMTSLYSDTMTPQEVTDFHRELFAKYGENARSKDSFTNIRSTNRKIQLGFISADFGGRHPVSIFMNPILEHFNRNKFHTTIYNMGSSFDKDTHKARSLVDVWRESKHLTQAQVAKSIENDKIDILIELSGHIRNNKLLFLAKRLAPVQVTFLGYPGSTGVPNIDWIFADKVVAPKEDDHLFSEKIARLDGTVFCYAPEEDFPIPRWDDSQVNRPITFGTFNNILKITPHTIRLWGEILKAVPESRMFIKSPAFREIGAVHRYQKLFQEYGVNPNRLIFKDVTKLNEMMEEYLDIDIALDPTPYNGGTTTLQAMWMGCPVITKRGGLFVSQMGASFLSAAGMSDWIAKSDQEYIDIAIEKTKDRDTLWRLKKGLRERLLKNDAWNIVKYTKNIEKFLEMMWKEECERK